MRATAGSLAYERGALLRLEVIAELLRAREGLLGRENKGWLLWHDSRFLITTDTEFTPSTCTLQGSPCTLVEIDPVTDGGSITEYLSASDYARITGFLPSFFTVGNHIELGRTLVITQVSSVTPEPSSIALLGTGMLGVAGVMRKRLA